MPENEGSAPTPELSASASKADGSSPLSPEARRQLAAEIRSLPHRSTIVLALGLLGSIASTRLAHADTMFLPFLGRGAQEIGEPLPSVTPIAPGTSPTPKPTHTSTPEPSRTATPTPTEQLPTPEAKKITLSPDDIVWPGGAADPYNPFSSFRKRGMQWANVKGPGSGWLADSGQAVYRLVTEQGFFDVLGNALRRQLSLEEIPPDTEIAEGQKTGIIRRVLADKLKVFPNLPHANENPLQETGDIGSHQTLEDFFGPLPRRNIDLSPQHAAQASMTDSEQGMTPLSELPFDGDWDFRGVGPTTAFEVVQGEGFTIDLQLQVTHEGLFGLGYATEQEDGTTRNMVLTYFVKGGNLYMIDSAPDKNGSHARYFLLDVRTTDGVIDVRTIMNGTRDEATIVITDSTGREETLIHPLQREWEDRKSYGVYSATRPNDMNAVVSASVEFESDPERVRAWQGGSTNLERVARLSDQRISLMDIAGRDRIGIPSQTGDVRLEYVISDEDKILYHGDRLVIQDGPIQNMLSGEPGLPYQGNEFFRKGNQPFMDGVTRAAIERQRAQGNTNFKALIITDWRTRTIDLLGNKATGPEIRSAQDNHYTGYNSSLFDDGVFALDLTGRVSDALLRGVDLNGAKTTRERAARYAESIMARLEPGAKYEGVVLIDPDMPLGLLQKKELAEVLRGVNSIEGFHWNVMMTFIAPPNMVDVQSFIKAVNETGSQCGIYEADAFIPFDVANDLTRNQLGRPALLTVRDPIDPDRLHDRDTTLLAVQEGERVLEYTSAYKELIQDYQ